MSQESSTPKDSLPSSPFYTPKKEEKRTPQKEKTPYKGPYNTFAKDFPPLIAALEGENTEEIFNIFADYAVKHLFEVNQNNAYTIQLESRNPKEHKAPTLDELRKSKKTPPVLIKHGESFYVYGLLKGGQKQLKKLENTTSIAAGIDFEKQQRGKINTLSKIGEEIADGHYHKSYKEETFSGEISTEFRELISRITPKIIQKLQHLQNAAIHYLDDRAERFDEGSPDKANEKGILLGNAIYNLSNLIINLAPEDKEEIAKFEDEIRRQSSTWDAKNKTSTAKKEVESKDSSAVQRAADFLLRKRTSPTAKGYKIQKIITLLKDASSKKTTPEKANLINKLVEYGNLFVKALNGQDLIAKNFLSSRDFMKVWETLGWTLETHYTLVSLQKAIENHLEKQPSAQQNSNLDALKRFVDFLIQISPSVIIKEDADNPYNMHFKKKYPKLDFLTPGDKKTNRRGSASLLSPIEPFTQIDRGDSDSKTAKQLNFGESNLKKGARIVVDILSLPFTIVSVVLYYAERWGNQEKVVPLFSATGILLAIPNILFRPQAFSDDYLQGKYKLPLVALHLAMWVVLALYLTPLFIAEGLLPVVLSNLAFMALTPLQELAALTLFSYAFMRQVAYWMLSTTSPNNSAGGVKKLGDDRSTPSPSDFPGAIYSSDKLSPEPEEHKRKESKESGVPGLIVKVEPPASPLIASSSSFHRPRASSQDSDEGEETATAYPSSYETPRKPSTKGAIESAVWEPNY